jgi:molecular chaperone DnaK
MQHTINFGIDLGTTNSAIGFYSQGKAIILKNPKGFRELLPSAIAYKNGRILVGEKALDLLQSQPGNVFTSFKRSMGTDAEFQIENSDIKTNPLELSAEILKTLIGFEQDNPINSCVITIPASFDTVQSNATKKAGELAGLKEVVLLQEPVAACLAYANDNSLDMDKLQRWLVYDFGGGTFDCALVEINQRELKVKNHLGNNFLGGFDIDFSLMQKIIMPLITQEKLESISATQKKALEEYLLHQLEEAKKELSLKQETLIEIEFDELDIYTEFTLTRTIFDEIVKPYFDESVQLMEEMLQASSFTYKDLDRIVLVGGTTYIPYIREQLKVISGLVIDSSIDPTTAVVKGATYYAGTKPSNISLNEDKPSESLKIQLVYESSTRDEEELIIFKSETDFVGFYEIIRLNDSKSLGIQSFKNEAEVFAPVISSELNQFRLIIYNKQKLKVSTHEISISQGLYSVSGQPLPADICLELDSGEEDTFLEPVFLKNNLLPLKKTIYKTLSKTVVAGSEDAVFINVLEGRRGTLPASNLSIGLISIKGKLLKHDLVKGTPIELDIRISESRDLTINVLVPSSDLELKSTFNPHIKIADLEKIELDIKIAVKKIAGQITIALQEQEFDVAEQLQNIANKLELLLKEDVEQPYKLDEKKRSLLKELDKLNRSNKLQKAIEEWEESKLSIEAMKEDANPSQKEKINQIIATEKELLNSGDYYWIKRMIKELNHLFNEIYYSIDKNYVSVFLSLRNMDLSYYTNPDKALKLFDNGEKALLDQNYSLVREISYYLLSLIDKEHLKNDEPALKAIIGIK